MKKYLLSATVPMLAIVTGAVTYMQVKTTDDNVVKYDVDKVEQIDYEQDESKASWNMFTKTADGKVDKYDVSSVVEVILTNDSTISDTTDTAVQGVSVSGRIESHSYVDLGLPSGLKWATYNVGATLPTEYGNYYSWGETETKSFFGSTTYKVTNNPPKLTADQDAATVNWGDSWCMPTEDEVLELATGCTWEKVGNFNNTEISGVLGTSKTNGNTIFIPFSGIKNQSTVSKSYSGFWTSDIHPTQGSVYAQFASASDTLKMNGYTRYCGLCVRPVSPEKFNVKFYDQDSVVIDSQTVFSGRPAVLPTIDIKDSFVFSWSDSAFVCVTKDLDIYAKYTAKPVYTINFYNLDSTLIKSQYVMDGTSTSLVEIPELEGYKIIGWSDSSFISPKTDMDIYALYSKITYYTINFYASDSTTLIETQTVEKDMACETVKAPAIKDYRFVGWCDTTLSNVQSDLNVYAQYVPLVVTSGSVNEYDYVDLGLPSGLKWASYNVGAKAPSEKGNYFAWGEYNSKTKNFNWTGYRFNGTTKDTNLKKYNKEDKLTTLETEDDAATYNWGESWHIPTHAEQLELQKGCTWEWTDNFNGTGVQGMMGISKVNGNVIFLPLHGYISNSYELNDACKYLSSSIYSQNSTDYTSVHIIDLRSGKTMSMTNSFSRCHGGQIRAVCGNSYKVNFYSADKKLLSSQLIGKDDSAKAPEGPEKAAYKFVGWSDSSFTKVQSDLNIYAKYELIIDGKIGDHPYVDLGLPSGLKWACYNVGATKLSETGDYFAWGETKTKEEFGWSHYKFGTMDNLSKYTEKDSKTVLEAVDDAATANWNSTWRMPTNKDMKELIESCTWEWVENFDGCGAEKWGLLGTSIYNGNVIYFRDGDGQSGGLIYSGGHYWTSSLDDVSSDNAYCLLFGKWRTNNDDYDPVTDFESRSYGCNVRAVSK